MNTNQKIIRVFFIIIGISLLGLWPFLVFSGSIPDLDSRWLSFGFHWASELLLAVFCLITAWRIGSINTLSSKLYYFTSGLMFTSTLNAGLWYVFFEPDVMMASLMGLFTIINLVLLVISWKQFSLENDETGISKKLEIFSIGLMIYALLNISGNLLEARVNVAYFAGFSILMILLLGYKMVREFQGS